MASRIGAHSERLRAARALLAPKGRREARRFLIEGSTQLAEAAAAGYPVEEIFATEAAYGSTPLLRDLEAGGTPTFLVEESAERRISDLTTPTGIVAVAPMRAACAVEIFRLGGTGLVLADLNDPANAGTLLRSADAFGCAGVVFGALGVDPYHPKVVRGSMGAVFRLAIAVADPSETADAAQQNGLHLIGLAAVGAGIREERWEPPIGLVVGHERRGLGPWEALCKRTISIPMSGAAESLNAAVAGSIALYEASRRQA